METEKSKRAANKIEKKALLVAKAQLLFLHKGFENTTIDEIARDAQLTKRTLYQYFVTKEDLFFAVVLNGSYKMIEAFDSAIEKGSTALEKISLANTVYYQFYLDNPDMFRLMNYSPENIKNCITSPHNTELTKIKNNQFKKYMDIIEEGKSDGSINSDLNTKMAVFFGFFSSIGLLNLVSSIDERFWDKQQLDQSEFIQFSFNLLKDALK